MSTIAASQRQTIHDIVGPDRARFDKRERRIYSRDTGVLPSRLPQHLSHFGR